MAAMPSPRPVKPIWSVVVAVTDTGQPTAADNAASDFRAIADDGHGRGDGPIAAIRKMGNSFTKHIRAVHTGTMRMGAHAEQ